MLLREDFFVFWAVMRNASSCCFGVYAVLFTEATKIYGVFFRVKGLDAETGLALLAFQARAPVTQHQRPLTLPTTSDGEYSL